MVLVRFANLDVLKNKNIVVHVFNYGNFSTFAVLTFYNITNLS